MTTSILSGLAGKAAPHSRCFALALLAGQVLPAVAADYTARASFDVQATHNDNLRMSEENKVSVNKYLTTPLLALGASTERTTFGLTSIFYLNKYSDSRYDSNDMNIGLALNHKLENSAFGLNANYVRDSTITSEELTTGIVGDTAKRATRYMVSPSYQYFLSDKNMLQFQGSYIKQDYEASDYTAYDRASGGIDWVHSFDERLKMVLSATYSDYESEDVNYVVPLIDLPRVVQNPDGSIELDPLSILPRGSFGDQSYRTRTKEKGGQIGVDYQWSEQSLIQARLGSSESESSYPLESSQDFCSYPQYQALALFPQIRPYLGSCDREDTSDRVSTAQLAWTWQNENHDFNLNATKQTQPTSSGYTVDSLQVLSNWNYRPTELDQFGVSLTVVRNRSIDDSESVRNSAIGNRDYESASLSYRRQFGEEWFVSTIYTYSHQRYTELDTNAHGSAISLAIRYRPQAWHWAR